MRSALPGAKLSASMRKLLNDSVEQEELIITPLLREFLARNPNLTVDKGVARKLAYLMSTPQRDRSGSFSASAAGTCYRRQELVFLGVTPGYNTFSPQQIAIFHNGTWVHLRWQATLLTAGILESAEVTVKKPSLTARCTLDGMGTAQIGKYEGETFGFELKGRNDYAYQLQLKAGVDDKTRRQVDFQFALSGFEVISVINENKNTQAWNEWVFERDRQRVKTALNELRELNDAIERKRLHPMLSECRRREGEWEGCPLGGIGGPCENAGNWPNLK